jgi:hypothetical protein
MVEATIIGLPFVPLENAFEIVSFLDECYNHHCPLNTNAIAQFVCLFGCLFVFNLFLIFLEVMGRDSAVGIATRCGLDGPGVEFLCGRDFPHLSRPPLGPTQPPIQWVPGLYRGQSDLGVALTTHPHLAPRLKIE